MPRPEKKRRKIIFYAGFFLALGIAQAFATTAPVASSHECVNVYFDQSQDPSYWMGKTYATMLQNLLGHFPEFQQIVSPIELYKAGDIEKCRATFYIGSYFDNGVPPAFYADYAKTEKNVAWLGYGIWNFSAEQLDQMFGYRYGGLTTLDRAHLDKDGQPTFFKDIQYKGETFSKYGKFNADKPTEFLAPFEMTILRPGQDPKAEVLATARHNGTGEILPYAIQGKNHFYLTDVPFSFVHEADRYLVFCDLLFDILNVPPKRNEHLAVVRIEDIHPLVPISYLYSASKELVAAQVPFQISLIPIFYDPLNEYTRDSHQEFVPLTHVPEFMQFLSEVRAQGTSLIWHGVTHQLGNIRNPFSAVSGDDFEFWDASRAKVLDNDSANFVLDRLDSGFYDLQKAGITPKIWITPHYQASPTDYYVFGKVFPWNMGRVIYFNHHLVSAPQPVAEQSLWYSPENDNAQGRQRRVDYFSQLKVATDSDRWSGQFFPFEILGDVYGQRVIPEDLGNAQPIASGFVKQPRSVEQMLADAKRNLVIRDSWGSFFYHVQLFNISENGGTGRYPGDPADLDYLVRGLKQLGYHFISLDDYVANHTLPIRPEPIYQNATIGLREKK